MALTFLYDEGVSPLDLRIFIAGGYGHMRTCHSLVKKQSSDHCVVIEGASRMDCPAAA